MLAPVLVDHDPGWQARGIALADEFRDGFRAHPEAVLAYARFKSVADGARGTYADVKDPVVDLVSTVAEPWATATGWTPHSGTGG